jgi:hypothetical protein
MVNAFIPSALNIHIREVIEIDGAMERKLSRRAGA